MVVDTRTELTSEELHDLGDERVKSFNRKWGTSARPPASSSVEPEKTESEPAWWENNIKNHIFEKREIKGPVLRSLYQEYLEEYYGVKDESELGRIFKKDAEGFGGTSEDEERAFGNYLFSNFSDWIKEASPAAIAEKRDEFELEPERGIEKKNNSERENGERIDLKIDWEKVFELAPWLRSQFREFVKIWGSGNVVELSLVLEGDAITQIGLIGDGGKFASITVKNIFEVIDGIEDFKNSITKKSGFKFSVSGEYIDPDTGISLAKRILSKVAIEDKKLNSDFWVHIGTSDEDAGKGVRRI
jgi:hypothetical protein